MFSALLLLPRALIVIWWFMDQPRWAAAFGSVLWPILGFILLPWTTLAYVLVAPNGLGLLDWVLIGLAVLADVGSWGGGAYGNRDRMPTYRSTKLAE
jgi:hypothetical protein